VRHDGDHVAQLECWARAYAEFCQRYPAFLDCALSLMHRPAGELQAMVSESVWLRLGQGIAVCVHHACAVLERGSAAGAFTVDDPAYMANVLWTQALGTMHLARIHVGIRQAAPGIPELFSIDAERVIESVVHSALAVVGARTR